MRSNPAIIERVGARRMAEVPNRVLAEIELGREETVNLMEWLAADMGVLASNVSAELPDAHPLKARLIESRDSLNAVGVTRRLRFFGDALSAELTVNAQEFEIFADHPSDIVRQWAAYAVNSENWRLTLSERLSLTRRYAEDINMSVREAAWMAFRPHVQASLDEAIDQLSEVAVSRNENFRRFAVEVTRPRSVWGAHIQQLKIAPQIAQEILEKTVTDESRYVRLAVGNWINDASKTAPDWAVKFCERWAGEPSVKASVIRRALRTLIRSDHSAVSSSKILARALKK